ncbi:MAG: helix-turn-helix transcriptional regulator [Desulfarculus sp.]|nr:helix-turn-helix transcriptional regulator [Desulfarculus sp.]
MRKNINAKEVFKELAGNPAYKKEYEALEEEFSLVEAVIKARIDANLTQQQLAEKMGTTQSVIARLESGGTTPSLTTLKKLAKATGTKIKISFERAA